MLTCTGLVAVATVILLVGSLLILALIPTALAVFLLAVVLTVAGIIVVWRWIYPWLVRMGRWAAQLRNIIFLFIVVVVGELVLKYILDRAGISVPTVPLPIVGREVTVIGLGVLCFALFLLLLGLVVWLVRGWRYTWPPARDVFWDSCFRIAALFWKILVGIPLGIVWFLYHPPLRWLVAALLFYLRGISAAAAWLLYNPPLKGIAIAILFVTRLIARVAAWLLYSLPVRWVVGAVVFILRLMARFISTVIYGIWSWWPIKGIRGTLRKGLTAQSKSYQDYKYA
ncbi:MAG: hypothetical protein WBH01_04675 [Dehalococcoidia bacterium]